MSLGEFERKNHILNMQNKKALQEATLFADHHAQPLIQKLQRTQATEDASSASIIKSLEASFQNGEVTQTGELVEYLFHHTPVVALRSYSFLILMGLMTSITLTSNHLDQSIPAKFVAFS